MECGNFWELVELEEYSLFHLREWNSRESRNSWNRGDRFE